MTTVSNKPLGDMTAQEISEDLNRVLSRMTPRDPRMQEWECEDGYIVGYTTERFGTGVSPFDLSSGPSGTGKFGFFLYKPERRKGEIVSWRLVRSRYLNKRKDAKRLATVAYWQHNPSKVAKREAQGWTLDRRTGEWGMTIHL